MLSPSRIVASCPSVEDENNAMRVFTFRSAVRAFLARLPKLLRQAGTLKEPVTQPAASHNA
jgi:hypothetical protein